MTGKLSLHLVGYASGVGAGNPGCADGPSHLKQSPYFSNLQNDGIHLYWEDILHPELGASKMETVSKLCQHLAEKVATKVQQKQFFTVLGGDHSSAVGTWSGAAYGCKEQGNLGLIWIDAHMDSHTPDTSETGNIHGMPLASLLGYGPREFTEILFSKPKLNPQNICLIGTRSFEAGEEALLKKLNVRIFNMDEIQKRGLPDIMKEAIAIATKNTAYFGVSIDVDGVDPEDAPGTGAKAEGGIRALDLEKALCQLTHHPKLIGIELVEFNPHLDRDQLTEKLVPRLILSIVKG